MVGASQPRRAALQQHRPAIESRNEIAPENRRNWRTGHSTDAKHAVEFAGDGMPAVVSTPNLIGFLECTARVIAVEGTKVTFQIEARDQHEIIVRGVHKRAVIRLESFRRRISEKSQASPAFQQFLIMSGGASVLASQPVSSPPRQITIPSDF